MPGFDGVKNQNDRALKQSQNHAGAMNMYLTSQCQSSQWVIYRTILFIICDKLYRQKKECRCKAVSKASGCSGLGDSALTFLRSQS